VTFFRGHCEGGNVARSNLFPCAFKKRVSFMNNPEALRRGYVIAMTGKTPFVIASEARQSPS